MAAAQWKFIVTDLQYNQIGELNDYFDMTITRQLNTTDSASFRIRSNHKYFTLFSTQKAMVKGYRNGILQMWMWIWTAEITGDNEKMSMAVNLVSPAVMLEHMYQTDGLTALTGNSSTSPFNPGYVVDRYRTFYNLFTQALLQRARYSLDPTILSMKGAAYSALYAAFTTLPMPPCMVPYKDLGQTMLYNDYNDRVANSPMSDRLARFSAGTTGFDWYWEPTEPQYYYMTADASGTGTFTSTTGTPPTITPASSEKWIPATQIYNIPLNTQYTQSVAILRSGRPFSSDKTASAVFEYGTGKFNLAGFTLSATRQYQANLIGQRLAGATAGAPQFGLYQPGGLVYDSNGNLISGGSTYADFVSRSKDWGVMTDFTQFDVSDATYLQNLLDESTNLRQYPMRRLAITPMSTYGDPNDPPQFNTDFFLGDVVGVHIKNPKTGDWIVNGSTRVFGVSWAIKDSGAETMTLTVQEGSN